MNAKLCELLNEKEKSLFIFDIDGVMYEAFFGKHYLSVNSDSVLRHYLKGNDVYSDIRPIKISHDLVKTIDKSKHNFLFLTRMLSSMDYMQKINKLENDLDFVEGKDIIGVVSEKDKIEVIRFYSKLYKNVVYIDDNLETALQVDSLSELNVYGFHVSSLFVN